MPDRRQADRREGSQKNKTINVSLSTCIFSITLIVVIGLGIFTTVFYHRKGYDNGYSDGFTEGLKYLESDYLDDYIYADSETEDLYDDLVDDDLIDNDLIEE